MESLRCQGMKMFSIQARTSFMCKHYEYKHSVSMDYFVFPCISCYCIDFNREFADVSALGSVH